MVTAAEIESKGNSDQWIKAAHPFNPVSGDGAGRPYVGENVNRLMAAMKERETSDPRFVTAAQAVKQGWQIAPGAKPVKVFFRGEGNVLEDRELYSAVDVVGMPALGAAVEKAAVVVGVSSAVSASSVRGLGLEDCDNLLLAVCGPSLRNEIQISWEKVRSDFRAANENVSQLDSYVYTYVEELAQRGDLSSDEVAQKILVNLSTVNRTMHQSNSASPAPGNDVDVEPDALEVLGVDADEEEDLLEVVPMKVTLQQGSAMGVSMSGAKKPEEVAADLRRAMPATLQDGKFVRNEGGEYRRADNNKLALVDRGSSVLMKDKSADAYEALFELAEAKGWTEIELRGKPKMKSEAWVQAQLRGITVKNYVPTEADKLRLVELQKERAAALNAPTVPAPAAVTGDVSVVDEGMMKRGIFVGSIVAVDGERVFQNAGRGELVSHAVKALSSVPVVKANAPVEIRYKDGVGTVTERQQVAGLGQGR